MLGVTWNVALESSNHVHTFSMLHRMLTVDKSPRERTSLHKYSTTLTWLPIWRWFESDDPKFRSNFCPLLFLLINQQLAMLWLAFFAVCAKGIGLPVPRLWPWVIVSPPRPSLTLAGSFSCFSWEVSFDTIVNGARPIDFLRNSSDNIAPTALSNVSLVELWVIVILKTSQLVERLERSASAWISSSKY